MREASESKHQFDTFLWTWQRFKARRVWRLSTLPRVSLSDGSFGAHKLFRYLRNLSYLTPNYINGGVTGETSTLPTFMLPMGNHLKHWTFETPHPQTLMLLYASRKMVTCNIAPCHWSLHIYVKLPGIVPQHFSCLMVQWVIRIRILPCITLLYSQQNQWLLTAHGGRNPVPSYK